MKLLFDQNLSRKLVTQQADIFPDASHVQLHGLAETSDSEIWVFAKMQDFCIVTQDVDIAERSRLYGAPPKVVWRVLWKRADIAGRNSTPHTFWLCLPLMKKLVNRLWPEC